MTREAAYFAYDSLPRQTDHQRRAVITFCRCWKRPYEKLVWFRLWL